MNEDRKKIINSYSNYAEQWATRMRSGKNIAHKYLEKPAMYKRLPNLKGKKVLAIGCGTGEECEYLKSLGADKVVGIDLSEGLIEYAKKSYPNIEFHVMDMEEINLGEKFDFIYSSLVMHYVESWNKVLDNISKVMKDDAIFLFSTHHPSTWGAERTREENERISILGYKKIYEKEKIEIFGDYLNTRKISDTWFRDFDVSFYHRPLEFMIKDILESNFKITDLAEPKAIPETKEKDRMFYEIHEKIPLFIIFVIQKDTN